MYLWAGNYVPKITQLQNLVQAATFKPEISIILYHSCGRLTVASCQLPAQTLSHSLYSTGQMKKIGWKRSWVEIKTGISLSSYHHGHNRHDLGKKKYIAN